jgi:pimeloyl-ACP methyl ester carboxylesterase
MPTETHYDEFALYHENAQEWDLPFDGPPRVRRVDVDVSPGQTVSTIQWGTEPPQIVFLHGGGQNAHTWDTLSLALGKPALAIDLPGHGHSSWREDRDYWPWSNADAVITVLEHLDAKPSAVVGMSLGGLTTIRLGSVRPDLTPKVVIVDVTPGVHKRAIEMTLEERGSTALIGGPKVYDSFEEMVEATVALTPNRPRSAVQRGVLHNSKPLDDGKWRWRYDIGTAPQGSETQGNDAEASQGPRRDFVELWDDVENLRQPALLVRGGDSKFVLDEHEEEFRRRKPDVQVAVVPHAGHAVQSDQPLVLRDLIKTFVFSDAG